MENTALNIILLFLSGSSALLNTSVLYKLGKIETIIGMCPTCQHKKKGD